MSDIKIVNIAVSPTIYKDKFLLIKRIKPPYKDLWCLPGGKIEIGEHPQETVIRELQEETDLKVKFVQIKGVVSEILKTKNKIDGHYIIWVCETHTKTSKFIEKDEGEPKWFTKEELIKDKASIIPSDFLMINEFFIKKSKGFHVYKSHMNSGGKNYLLDYFGT